MVGSFLRRADLVALVPVGVFILDGRERCEAIWFKHEQRSPVAAPAVQHQLAIPQAFCSAEDIYFPGAPAQRVAFEFPKMLGR